MNYLVGVTLDGSREDKSLSRLIIMRPEQFMHVYEAANLDGTMAFKFMDIENKIETPFNLSRLKSIFKAQNKEHTLTCLANMEENGFRDSEGNPDVQFFLDRVVGKSKSNNNEGMVILD